MMADMTLVTTLPRRENHFVDPNQEVIMGAPAVRFSVLGAAGITVNSKNLQELQTKGSKTHYCLPSPLEMRAVVAISKNSQVFGITDLSKPLEPAHKFQSETPNDRHVALWANEQEMSLGSQMDLHMKGPISFDLTIGLTDGSIPAIPIGIASFSFNEEKMRSEGSLGMLLDIPIRNASDGQTVSLESNVTSDLKKKKKKRWLAKGSKGPSGAQEKAFQSVYSTDTSGDSILRVQIQLNHHTYMEQIEKPSAEALKPIVKHCIVDLDQSIADSEDGAPSAAQMIEELETEEEEKETSMEESTTLQKLAQERVVIDQSTNNCRDDTQIQKNEISHETKEEEVANSEDEAVSAEQMMKELKTEEEEIGISMEEYTMLKKLAQKRVVIDQSTNNCQKNEIPHETKEEEREENKLSNMFRGAMDLAISNFFGSGQPAIYRNIQRLSKAVIPNHDEDQADTSTPASSPTPAPTPEQPQEEQPRQRERKERREPYPPVPTTVVTGPLSESLHGLDDDTCTSTAEGSFLVAPETRYSRAHSVPETKDEESLVQDPSLRDTRPIDDTRFRVIPPALPIPLKGFLRCGEYEDTRSFNNQDDTNRDFHLKQLELYEQQEDEFTEEESEEESRRVPAVILQYDLQNTTNDELTVESRDFPPFGVDRDWDDPRDTSILRTPKYSGYSVPVALGGTGRCLSRQQRRLVSKRPNRTVGPDDESTASEDSIDSLGSAIEQMEIKFFPEVEESQIDASVKGLSEEVY
jgi:hypothetical protein